MFSVSETKKLSGRVDGVNFSAFSIRFSHLTEAEGIESKRVIVNRIVEVNWSSGGS